MSNRCTEGHRKGMKIKLFKDAVDQVGPIAGVVDTVEGIARGTYR